MDLKSYLRGLGLGMVVCACIIGLSNSKNKISDAEIKARAAKLGMVEQDKGVLTQLMSDGSEAIGSDNVEQEIAKEEVDIPDITIVPANQTSSETKEEIQSNTVNDQADSNSDMSDSAEVRNQGLDAKLPDVEADANIQADDEPDSLDEKENNVKENKIIVVTVYPGEGSYTVSKKLANLGLVESADVFDRFLCQNGYDKRLSTGNYNISVGSSAENIAKQLTGG